MKLSVRVMVVVLAIHLAMLSMSTAALGVRGVRSRQRRINGKEGMKGNGGMKGKGGGGGGDDDGDDRPDDIAPNTGSPDDGNSPYTSSPDGIPPDTSPTDEPAPEDCVWCSDSDWLSDLCSNNHCTNIGANPRCCELLKNGEQCTSDNQCKSGKCDNDTNRCIHDGPFGELDDYCSDNGQCISGWCYYDRCRQPMGVLSTCVENYECLSGFCNSGNCGRLRDNGEWCYSHEQCQSKRCDIGSWWGPDNSEKCIPVDGTGVSGEDFCDHNNQCQSGWCYASRCRTTKGNGIDCSSDEECQSKRCDVGSWWGPDNSGKCISNDGEGKPGEFCDHDNQCQSGWCEGNSCREKKENGESCQSSRECKSGNCATFSNGSRKCQTLIVGSFGG